MMSEFVSIREMAKQRIVTAETLRHYNRIGLMKPIYVSPE
jgi:DNA-binding transcriptional MerR regulator